MLIALFDIAHILLQVMIWIIIIQAILSWLVAFNVVNTHNDFVRGFYNALDRITRPLYRPVRRILPDFGGLDFSPSSWSARIPRAPSTSAPRARRPWPRAWRVSSTGSMPPRPKRTCSR